MTNVYRVQQQHPPLVVLGYIIGPFLIIVSHLGVFLLLSTGLGWNGFLWVFLLYVVRAMGLTCIYHRLIIHKAFQAPSIVKWVGSFIASSAGQMGPNWWKGHHLEGHHQVSDCLGDSHSPNVPFRGFKGFWWSQGGWLLATTFFPPSLPVDVESDVVLKVIDRLHFVPVILLALISYWIGGLEFLGAFFLSTVLLYHGIAFVNSLTHIVGEQPFITTDNSRNNWFVALVALGEGWHNLHHAAQWSARHGYTIRDGKIVRLPDPTYWFIKLLEKFNLASNIKLPTEEYLLGIANQVEVRQF
jgi:stearoyl-CoA desaturase (Delta-9 desaturase)